MAAIKRIFSGIQPTGVPHIGNYFGAMKNWVSFQNEERAKESVLFSIVDLHGLTVPKDPKEYRENIHKTAISLLAAGLSPNNCIIYQQSKVKKSSFRS